MRITKDLPIANIKMDRWPICPQTFDLATKLEGGLKVPPIHVAKLPNGQYKICDGRHRVTAFKLLGRNEIEARFSTETLRDGMGV